MGLDDHETKTDASARTSWQIAGPVFRLREWGRERVYGLPNEPIECTLGAASSCRIQLRDAPGQISREHARLVPCPGGWKLVDLGSKNGLWRDGVRHLSFALTPGLEIGIGSLRLIAESRPLIALRALLCRFLGWASERQDDVDEAMRTMRDWAAQRSALVLSGTGDLPAIAKRLHIATLGPSVPYVACAEHSDGVSALQAAGHGALWMWAHQLPSDFASMVSWLRESNSRTRLVVCARNLDDAAVATVRIARTALVAVPALSSRRGEIDRLVRESADDAAAELGAPSPGFTMNDLDRLSALELESVSEVEETVRRLVALRTWGVSSGATRLG
ncbi:MAG: FHA domain-containing protein, partial [Kofleriaceae bacterium]